MKNPYHYDASMMIYEIEEQYKEDEDALAEAYAELFKVAEILESSYKKLAAEEYSCDQDHMMVDKQTKCKAILKQHQVLFQIDPRCCTGT